jgi:hypothetical protein
VVEGQEGVEEKVALKLGNVMEVTVIVNSGVGAEVGLLVPDSVPFLVCGFLFRVKDDLAIHKAGIAKDNTSLGSGQIYRGVRCWCRSGTNGMATLDLELGLPGFPFEHSYSQCHRCTTRTYHYTTWECFFD